jgi:uncharacterized protein YndB with AHSA1/START domain
VTSTEILTASVRIEAAPEAIFPYLVDPALIVAWIGHWADLDPVPGGVFALDMNQTAVRGRFLAIEPPTRVVFTWGIPGNDVLPAGSTTVEIVLTAEGPDTLVELTHRDLPAVQLPGHREGWARLLPQLADAVARGRA